jgi:DNA polymerase-3 subunit gamma/tau
VPSAPPPLAPVESPAATQVPPAAPPAAPTPVAPAAAAAAPAGGDLVAAAVERWSADIKPTLKGFARAMYSSTTVLGERNGAFTIGVSNETQRLKCEEHRRDVEAAIAVVVGGKVTVQLVIHSGPDDHDDDHAGNNVVPLKRVPEAVVTVEEEAIDLDDLIDAPPESNVSPIDRLTQAFPGSQLVEE